jgi:Ca-activated chloride channel family protein
MMPATLMTDAELARLGTRDDATFGSLATARGALPLCAMAIDARVLGLSAAIDLAQTFENTLAEPIEATYVFPLPDRAAVIRFRLEVGGRVVEGVVDERGAARATYDQAIAAGQRAAIAEEDRPGVFSLRVGNLMPRDVAIIRITLVGPLPVEDGEVTFRFPLVVAPRYIPGHALPGPQAGLGVALDTDAVPDASRITPPVRLPGLPNPVRLSIRLTIDGAGLPISDVRASLHQILLGERAGARVIELGAGERLDRDFNVRWAIGDDAVRTSAVWAPDADGGAGTFLLTLVPPRAGEARPRDVVFVLDRSGSMQGWKMVCARRAVARMIDSLGPRDRFAALAFDTQIDEAPGLAGALTPATDRNRFQAIGWLASVDSRGGTELAEPLTRAAAMLAGSDDRDRVLVLVTDGQVGNEDQILRDLGPRLRGARVFTLGIDQAVNAAFLRRLAAAGGGACELCESEDRLDAVMDKVHRRIATPVVTELAIEGEGALIHGAITPARLPALFAGAPIVIAGRLRSAPGAHAVIAVTGRTPAGAPWRERVTLGVAPASGSAVAAMWARGHIRDLEDRYAITSDPALERALVEVSKRHNVLSRFTAFVAVDRNVVNPGGGQRQIVQAVEAPAGWGGKADVAEQERGSASGAAPAAAPARTSRVMGMARAPAPTSADASRMRGASGGPPGMPGGVGSPPGMPGGVNAPAKPSFAAAPGGPAAPPPPMSQAAPLPLGAPAERKRAEKITGAPMMPPMVRSTTSAPHREEAPSAAPAADAPYRERARLLAIALERAGAARAGRGLELAIARLAELIEDLISIDPRAALAVALAPILDRLRRAIATGLLAAEATAAAGELRALADGPAAPPPPAPTGRAFWK